ncbi:hypothetical protein F2Q70_00018582 [Brassica cretica]|uniref:Uncharacterized protein n=1 Tax=Brassica cretica TaxID=69181 RepID=A0A8S9HY33_BRACR|nr:hypothetical protein F2Q70_00018582 [Brassica cretica]
MGHFVHMRFTENWKEALTTLLSQNPHITNNVTTSLDNEYAQVFGPERPGQVRCVGRGPTPSKLVCCSTVNRQDIENSEWLLRSSQRHDYIHPTNWYFNR